MVLIKSQAFQEYRKPGKHYMTDFCGNTRKICDRISDILKSLLEPVSQIKKMDNQNKRYGKCQSSLKMQYHK